MPVRRHTPVEPRTAARRRLIRGLAMALAAASGVPVWAQSASERSVHLLVGYAPGGPVDAMARIFAPAFAQALGQTVIVENKPGASGAVAGELCAAAAPDGLTLFFAASPTITIVPLIQKKLRYDPQRDLLPIAPLLSYANVLVVHKDNRARSLADLLAQARANPGKLFYGSAGVGASNHLSGELLAHQAKVQLVHVPYKGNAPAMSDVIGGQITMMFDIVGGAQKYIAAGQVRALAVTSPARNPMLPEVPTMREAGLPGVEVGGWYALYGPPKLPAAAAERVADAVRKVQASPDFQARLAALGYSAWSGSGADVAATARKELAVWGAVTQGIEME